jgi:sec-independent protein translocase protein TatA
MYYNFLFLSGGELMLVFVVFLLLFGSSKIPELAKGLGKGLREFKKATDDIKREINESSVGDISRDISESASGIRRNISEITSNITEEVNASTEEVKKDMNEISNNING